MILLIIATLDKQADSSAYVAQQLIWMTELTTANEHLISQM